MIRKLIITVLFAYALYFIPAFFIWYFKEDYKIGYTYAGQFAIQFLFYSLPVIPITFVVLLAFNYWFGKGMNQRSSLENNKFYFLILTAVCIVPTFALTLFDYFQFNALDSSETFLSII